MPLTTEEICLEWSKNKIINPDKPLNPITKYTVKKNGKIYKELEKLCSTVKINKIDIKDIPIIKKKSVLSKSLNKELCLKWMKNKYQNPITNYVIKETGEIYKELKRECPIILKEEGNDYDYNEGYGNKDNQKSISKRSIIKKKKQNLNYDDKKDEIIESNYFPDIDDPEFRDKLMSLKEINVHKINKYDDINNIQDFEKKAQELCKGFDKSFFQYLMGQYLSIRMPYKSILIYYSVGVGKTCTAITIAENFLINHNSYEEPKIWVIMPHALEDGFKQQIFKRSDYKFIANQCTGDLYYKLSQINENMSDIEVDKIIKKLIKSRYLIFTYDGFANFYETNYIKKNKIATDKIIIVDEAHNIRQGKNETEKKVYNSLVEVAKTGINNKMVLLTATPMYNEPRDLFDLIELLLLNDKKDYKLPKKLFNENNELTKDAKIFIETIASTYISFLKGNNPFSFPFKLSPNLSNFKILDKVIPLTSNGKQIDKNDNNWVSKVKDGIVISNLGKKQIEYLKSKKTNDDNFNDNVNQDNFKSFQPLNIVYDDEVGSKGFYKFFRKSFTNSINSKDDTNSYKVSYNPKFKNALYPDNEHLGLYSGKILNIMNIIKKTEGIIVIYSNFLHTGLIPTAIALEHLGFSRYGSDNILENSPDIKKSHIFNKKNYCILTSEGDFMGNTTISKLINVINDPSNINGDKIKVILISPVAGEGLNIYNVREIHLLNMWYHFNKTEQIIGRGIRNCSHKNLPIELRNVTVFMHCAINDYQRETADVSAYRIATRKLYQSQVINNLIRNNSIDCSLFKNINYFPKSMFKLGKIKIRSSQNVLINYELGDEKDEEPVCSVDDIEGKKGIKEDTRGFRQDTYKHLSLNIQMKLKNLIIQDYIQNEIYFISYKDINHHFRNIDNDILMYSITLSVYPNIIIDNHFLIPHEEGIHIIKIDNESPLKITLVKEEAEKEDMNKITDNEIDLYKNINKIKSYSYEKAIIALYLSFDLISFNYIINKILSSPNSLNEIDNFIANCLYKEGILISNKEISIGSTMKFIGFVNIFNDEFEPLLFNDGEFKILTPKQLEQLKKNRRNVIIPEMKKEKLIWGIITPEFIDKEKKNKKNLFKIITPGEAYGKKTGIVCSYLHKPQHKKLMETLSIPDGKYTKEGYCMTIAEELYKINRISLYPSWKPLLKLN